MLDTVINQLIHVKVIVVDLLFVRRKIFMVRMFGIFGALYLGVQGVREKDLMACTPDLIM